MDHTLNHTLNLTGSGTKSKCTHTEIGTNTVTEAVYPFKRHTFVPYLPLRFHFSTLKIHISA